MRSTEVYKTIRDALEPWCRANGFTDVKSGWLAYQKRIGGKFLSFWFQCDRYGWDPYSGSRFAVEFQFDESPDLGKVSNRRIQEFLTTEELEFVRELQNGIIAKIPPPPDDWITTFENNARRLYKDAEMIIDGFRDLWRPVAGPLSAQDNLWLRYWDADDVKTWGALILNVLPRIVAQYAEVQTFEPSA